jgi:tyrosine-protein kinase Etk/Wzc
MHNRIPNSSVDLSKSQIDYPSNQDDDDEINLGELFGILLDNKWLIIAITLATLCLGIAKAFHDKPVYKADGLLQAKENSQSLAGLEPLTGLLDGKTPVLAEIELIKSRMILGKTVKSLHLDIIAKPKYFPVIGEAVARQFQKRNLTNDVASPLFNQIHYAWGGEAIQVDTLTIPADWEDEGLILQAGDHGQFKLIYGD